MCTVFKSMTRVCKSYSEPNYIEPKLMQSTSHFINVG